MRSTNDAQAPRPTNLPSASLQQEEVVKLFEELVRRLVYRTNDRATRRGNVAEDAHHHSRGTRVEPYGECIEQNTVIFKCQRVSHPRHTASRLVKKEYGCISTKFNANR